LCARCVCGVCVCVVCVLVCARALVQGVAA